jgi:hypothetical protein
MNDLKNKAGIELERTSDVWRPGDKLLRSDRGSSSINDEQSRGGDHTNKRFSKCVAKALKPNGMMRVSATCHDTFFAFVIAPARFGRTCRLKLATSTPRSQSLITASGLE